MARDSRSEACGTTTWKTTTSLLAAAIAVGGCAADAPSAAQPPTAPQTKIALVGSTVTRDYAEYVWEIQLSHHWNPSRQSEWVTTLTSTDIDQPETRRVKVRLDATHYPKGGMDVLLTRTEEFRNAQGNGDARAQRELIGLPTQPLGNLVTLRLTKPADLKAPSKLCLAELRFTASQYANLHATKNVKGWPKTIATKRVRLENGRIPDRAIRALDPKLLARVGRGVSVGSRMTKAETIPIEVHFLAGAFAQAPGAGQSPRPDDRGQG